MDFARKQLEKYGWTDGKGLGKHENGMAEPLKPKIKRSVAGIGHDPASEFNEHWWTALYDKAAGNVEVEEKNGKTKKIKTKEDFQITNSTWKLKQKPKDENDEQYSDYFVRTAVLTKGGSKVEKVKESDSEDEEEKRDVFTMTDEELFKACEGRTAHKGARHGLKATGKLARIAQQEALLLTETRFNGYSHAKKLKDKVVEEMNLNSDSDGVETKKKKKKRKRCNSNEKQEKIYNANCIMAESNELPLPENVEMTEEDNVTCVIKEGDVKKKSKKAKRKDICNIEVISEEDESTVTPKKKKNQINTENTNMIENINTIDNDKPTPSKKKKKKKHES